MVKKYMTKPSMAAIAIFMLFSFKTGAAQKSNIDMDSIAHNNVANMIIDALDDSSINIALCKVSATISFSSNVAKNENYLRIFTDLCSERMQAEDILRSNCDIDSIFFLSSSPSVTREGYEAFLPSFSPSKNSEWILFLDSPFLMRNSKHVNLMEKYERLNLQEFLNSNNFFTLYELNAGALCVYCPEDAKYRPQFVYSEGLVDDFKTIIRLQENPSLLSASADSYETYYSSLKDDLGKRVFERLFADPGQD